MSTESVFIDPGSPWQNAWVESAPFSGPPSINPEPHSIRTTHWIPLNRARDPQLSLSDAIGLVLLQRIAGQPTARLRGSGRTTARLTNEDSRLLPKRLSPGIGWCSLRARRRPRRAAGLRRRLLGRGDSDAGERRCSACVGRLDEFRQCRSMVSLDCCQRGSRLVDLRLCCEERGERRLLPVVPHSQLLASRAQRADC
jgi:hypothetical protein